MQEIPDSELDRYGVYKLKKGSKDLVEDAIEKPGKDKAPSNLAQFGRFILNTDIIKTVEKNHEAKKYGKDGELWLIDSIIEYAKKKPVYATRIKGKWMTTGDPLRFMKTAIEFALNREDIGQDLREYLEDLLCLECNCPEK